MALSVHGRLLMANWVRIKMYFHIHLLSQWNGKGHCHIFKSVTDRKMILWFFILRGHVRRGNREFVYVAVCIST